MNCKEVGCAKKWSFYFHALRSIYKLIFCSCVDLTDRTLQRFSCGSTKKVLTTVCSASYALQLRVHSFFLLFHRDSVEVFKDAFCPSERAMCFARFLYHSLEMPLHSFEFFSQSSLLLCYRDK